MKRIIVMAMVMLVLAVSAFADDTSVKIDNGNQSTNTNTNNNGNYNTNNNSAAGTGTATSSITAPLPEVGFAPFLHSGTPILSKGWDIYCPSIYSTWTVDSLEETRIKFHWWEVFTPWRWSSEVTFTPMGPALPKNNDPVTCINYWPEDQMLPGDKVLGVATAGDTDTNDEAFLASAIYACKTEKGSRRVAIHRKEKVDGITVGKSVGVSGLVSKLDNDADTGVAFASGGMLGKNRTHVDEYAKFKVLCMNDNGYVPMPPPPTADKPKAVPPAQVCSPEQLEIFLQKIREAEREIADCWRYSHNNFYWQKVAGRENINAWICTGLRKYLDAAINHYEMAELNYLHGYDIKQYSDSETILGEVEYGLASAFYARDGSIDNFWNPPKAVVHIDKKKGTEKSVRVTKDEKRRILKIRSTLERYSVHLTL